MPAADSTALRRWNTPIVVEFSDDEKIILKHIKRVEAHTCTLIHSSDILNIGTKHHTSYNPITFGLCPLYVDDDEDLMTPSRDV